MTAKQNRGAGKRRLPGIDHYDHLAEARVPSLFYVFYNGKVTEEMYFAGLSRKLIPNKEVRSKFLRLQFKEGTPRQLMDHAIAEVEKRSENGSFKDIVWVVFDKDDFGKNYSEAITLADKNQINAAYSNECFELWLLLHFQKQATSAKRKKLNELLREIREKHSGKPVESKQDAKHFPFGILLAHGNHQDAVARATDLYHAACQKNENTPWEVNPVTTIHQLVESLEKFFHIS